MVDKVSRFVSILMMEAQCQCVSLLTGETSKAQARMFMSIDSNPFLFAVDDCFANEKIKQKGEVQNKRSRGRLYDERRSL